jgi:hypothetical protein
VQVRAMSPEGKPALRVRPDGEGDTRQQPRLAARVRFALDQMRPARVGLMSTAHEQISAKRRGRRPLLGSIDPYAHRDRHCCPNTAPRTGITTAAIFLIAVGLAVMVVRKFIR